MEELARIVSPSSASWMAWVLLLLVCMVVMNRLLLQSVPALWHCIVSYSERVYTGGRSQTVVNKISSVLFRVGVMAICLCVISYKTDNIEFVNFAKMLGLVSLVFAIQWIGWKLVAYTFISPAQQNNVGEQRTLIYNAIYVLLLLLQIPLIHIANPLLKLVLVGVFVLLLISVMVVRGIQIFGQRSAKLLYVFLYIITLELLPLLGLIVWAKQII